MEEQEPRHIRHYRKNRDAILAKCHTYHQNNKEKIAARKKIYNAENAEHIKEKKKEKAYCDRCGYQFTKCHIGRHQSSLKCKAEYAKRMAQPPEVTPEI
jgi:hypothetical protein